MEGGGVEESHGGGLTGGPRRGPPGGPAGGAYRGAYRGSPQEGYGWSQGNS